jgi:ATP-dependent helicase HepA
VWRVGAKLIHPFNPELGVGVVIEIDGRFLVVDFPDADREMRLAAENSGLEPLVLGRGARARIEPSGEEVTVEKPVDDGYRLEDGRVVPEANLWPLDAIGSPSEQLARGQIDTLRAFRNRMAGLALQELREAGGLGSFLGGRIELFPHQLHTALKAVERERVRWLLADEVGLGKTIEACLILSALVRTGRADRALVIAPGTLVVQWLGELYRKFHQVFVLLDQDRIDSVRVDYEEDANPFEVHPYSVISLEMLASDRRLIRQAQAAGLELVVVDEAHRLGVEGTLDELSALIETAQHALLLTATPLQADRKGFYSLLHLLHPEEFPSFEAFEREVASGRGQLPCTSSVRRSDLGGLPPRVPVAVDLPEIPADGDPAHDPRARWIAERVRTWLERREKALVFVPEPAELERLARFLERTTHTHVALFHEDISQARRDIEIARFRDTNAPILLCSEAGGEGRNFQFCERMIHYELPPDPVALEQRIGRLDRIGRKGPVEIVYFRCEGARPDLARLYEQLDLFGRPSAGLDVALAGVRTAVAQAQRDGSELDIDALCETVVRERGLRSADLPRVFYPDAYDAKRAEEILAQVPDDLESRTRAFSLGAARDLGLTVVEKGGVAQYFMEVGAGATVEGLPGVPEGARYLGTFDRHEAIERDEIEFFASGHPLVEGLLLELEDGRRGRAALFSTTEAAVDSPGLLCVFRDENAHHVRVVDTSGNPRPEWGELLLDGLSTARSLDPPDGEAGERFGTAVRELAERAAIDTPGRLAAAAFFMPKP